MVGKFKIKVFPNVIIARSMGFSEEDFFEAEEEAKKEVKVKF